MDKLRVFVGGTRAGTLERMEAGYRFDYESAYAGPPVFLRLPRRMGSKTWGSFPPCLDGLLPEGVLLEQLLVSGKLDRADKWGQLRAVGGDVTGFLTLLPEGAGIPEVRAVAERRKARTRIQPGEEALSYEAWELVTFHSREAPRMSLSGVQPKVSAVFSRREGRFRMVAERGSYILKPSPQVYPEAAANEAVSMAMAAAAGIEVPHCGLVRTRDGQPVFWMERFDRQGAGNQRRLRVEDACQLLEFPSSWKYRGTLESLARMIRGFCGNPALQLARFFDRVVFNWVIGNGDMHLKNWSLMENGPLVELSPATDFLNTAILIDNEEESALELAGRKSGFDAALLLDTLGRELCGLRPARISRTLSQLRQVDWRAHLQASALSESARSDYLRIVESRMERLMRDGGGVA